MKSQQINYLNKIAKKTQQHFEGSQSVISAKSKTNRKKMIVVTTLHVTFTNNDSKAHHE
jgi:hypothetical protein